MAAILVAAFSGAACNLFHHDDTTSSSSTPETLSGTLAQGGSVTMQFTVTTAGAVSVTLTSMTPSTSASVSMGVGTFSNGNCIVTSSVSSVVGGTSAQLSTNLGAGTGCVKVSDTGSLTAPETVTVTVSHS